MIIGTTNPGKVHEIASICRPLSIPWETLELDVDETGSTFHANALLKAQAYSAARPGEVVLVEDSGLVVSVLGNLPGPWSARFHDHIRHREGDVVLDPVVDRAEIDLMNNELVLELLVPHPMEERGAFFEICLMVARDGQVLFEATGWSHGWIAPEMRGPHGFGYDPIFIGRDTYGLTYAELDPVRKNFRSHRKDALRHLSTWLASVVKLGRFHV